MNKKPDRKKLDALINLIKFHETSYYCKWCQRHLPLENGIYIHDDVYHPADYQPECGGEHKLQ